MPGTMLTVFNNLFKYNTHSTMSLVVISFECLTHSVWHIVVAQKYLLILKHLAAFLGYPF